MDKKKKKFKKIELQITKILSPVFSETMKILKEHHLLSKIMLQ